MLICAIPLWAIPNFPKLYRVNGLFKHSQKLYLTKLLTWLLQKEIQPQVYTPCSSDHVMFLPIIDMVEIKRVIDLVTCPK